MVVGEGVQREPPRNRFPLAVSFPHFFSAKRNGVAPQREKPPSKLPSRRSGQSSERSADSPLTCAICFSAPSPPAAYFLDVEKVGKDTPEGTYFEAVPSGLLPRRPRGLRPHWIPHFWTKDGGLRGTKDKGQRTGDEGCRTRNTAGPVGRFDRQAPMHWNHTTLFFPLPNRSPAERVRFGDDIIPASSPRPAPGPKARRACCRREAGGSPARSPAWRR